MLGRPTPCFTHGMRSRLLGLVSRLHLSLVSPLLTLPHLIQPGVIMTHSVQKNDFRSVAYDSGRCQLKSNVLT